MDLLSDSAVKDKFLDFFKVFLDASNQPKYMARLVNAIQTNTNSIVVDFQDILKFDPNLAIELTNNPTKYLDIFLKAAVEFLRQEDSDYAKKVEKYFVVRLGNLPEKVPIRKLDVSFLGKLVSINGNVSSVSEIKPYIIEASWVCPNGHTTVVVQKERMLKKPVRCIECDEEENFKLDELKSTFINYQILRAQELPEELPPGQLPRRLDAKIYGDSVAAAKLGDRVIINGIFRMEEEFGVRGSQSRSFGSAIESNYIEVLRKIPQDVVIEKADVINFNELAARPDWIKTLIKSFAPSIYNYDLLKEAILLLIAGIPEIERSDNVTLRNGINILLIGDPPKSELLKYTARLAPLALYAYGKTTEESDLTYRIVQENKENKQLRMAEAGLLISADHGLYLLDGVDDMKKGALQAFGAIEQQAVAISENGFLMKVNARTSILATAKLKFFEYDSQKSLYENVNLPQAFLNEFDLIFIPKKESSKEEADRIASHIITIYHPTPIESALDTEFLRKYLLYCRLFNPILTPEVEKMLSDSYLEMCLQKEDQSTIISPNILYSMIRLAIARARLLLRDKVTTEDVSEAVVLIKTMLDAVKQDFQD
ncbi:MAG: minichromosome maintenance protein MCM [Nitrososphaeria archaeon]